MKILSTELPEDIWTLLTISLFNPSLQLLKFSRIISHSSEIFGPNELEFCMALLDFVHWMPQYSAFKVNRTVVRLSQNAVYIS